MSTTSPARRRAAGAALALGALFVGCTSPADDERAAASAASAQAAAQTSAQSSDQSDAQSGEPATADGLRAAARNTADLLISADYSAAYWRLSTRCQAAIAVEAFIAQAAQGADQARRMGVDISAGVIIQVITEDVTATEGRANVIMQVDGESQEMGIAPFVYEDGAWHLDDCGDDTGPSVG